MARHFNGTSSDYINCGGSLQLNPPAMTLSAWIYLDVLPGTFGATVVRNNNGAVYYGIWINSSGKYHTFVYANSPVGYSGSGAFTLSLKRWYLMTMTYDSTAGLVAYVDGQVDGTAAANGAIAFISSNVFFGSDPSNATYAFPGSMSDCVIWDRALTQTEIAEMARGYHAYSIRPNHIVGYWPLDNAYGLHSGLVLDSGPYHNNGIINGTTPAIDPPWLRHIKIRKLGMYNLFNVAPAAGGGGIAQSSMFPQSMGILVGGFGG